MSRRPQRSRPAVQWLPLLRVAMPVALAAALLTPAVAPAATLVGTASADRLSGHSRNGDTIYGAGGRDTLLGGPGDDKIYGVRSDNVIRGGRGDNYIEGGTGADRISAKDGDNTVYGGTGRDRIRLGDGNNYVDPGAAEDQVTLGNGNNVVNGGSGGMVLRAGGGANTVYSRSGPDDIRLGSGVNRVYLGTPGQFAHIDCGGNPSSVLSVSTSGSSTALAQVLSARDQKKVVGCPMITTFDGPPLPLDAAADKWATFSLVGGDGPDQLYGGHGGGTIDGGGGDNVIWADRSPKDGGAYAYVRTTTITAGNGNNAIYGGHGTNVITVGRGLNFIRGGDHHNIITAGAGYNVIRLGGQGVNKVYLNGGRAYIESFAHGQAPQIRCRHGAHATIVYGSRAPRSHRCGTLVKASSPRGLHLQVRGVLHIHDSDPVVWNPIVPGSSGVGVARPLAAR